MAQGSREEAPQRLSYLESTAQGIEGRLLHLVKEVAQGAIPLADFVAELTFLEKDLRRSFRRVVDMKERRDLDFRTLRTLDVLESHYIWLYRKIHLEQTFFRKLHLEARLRSLLSTDALAVYQELLDAEEQEREFLGKGDAELRQQLLEGDCTGSP